MHPLKIVLLKNGSITHMKGSYCRVMETWVDYNFLLCIPTNFLNFVITIKINIILNEFNM